MNRKELRRSVMRELGDMRVLTATAAGTTTTLIDEANLYGEPGTYAGRLAYFSGGTAANLGLTRPVNGSSQADMAIIFSYALPAATAVGDEAELVNTYGMGWTFEDVHSAINSTIEEARSYGSVPVSEDIAVEFDEAGDRTVAIPDTFVGINAVQYVDSVTGHPVNIRRANVLGSNGWAVDHANREILINGGQAYRAHEQVIRLYGYGDPAPLTDDDDETALDPEWLHLKVCGRLLLNPMRSRQGQDVQGQGLYYSDKADRLRARLTPLFGPSYVRL
mgnify:CR=1 FL=1